MKKSAHKFLALAAVLFLLASCEEDLPTMLSYPSYEFSDIDADAGTWSTILLTTPDQPVVDAPEDVNSAAYLSELEDLKAVSTKLSDKQKSAVKYWTNNSTIRWNEIALELIAKYNLIPGPNADGTYTLPDPNNPGGPPAFPFAHPPYAVRALAYLSVAQFDGLMSAWHYKFLYDRPSPTSVDSEIVRRYPDSGIPSYPSHDAVIAVVSRDILTAMFPLEADYLSEMADEHMSSLQWAGVNVESDINAGEVIGAEVSSLALARASGDGMSAAQCSKEVSDQIKAEAFDRFGWQWENLEIPPRPVGLTPLFGEVDMWNVPNVEEVRPPVPPAPGSAEYEENVKELIHYADNMTDRWRYIANFWQDGLGTYTPPGHWNRIAKEWIVSYRMNPIRTVRTFAYLNMAMMDGGISCWDAKYYYHYPRPIQNIPGYKTIAGTPNFPSYTSGHSVFSAAGSEVLAYLFPADADTFRDWAIEAAESRIYGGIHWRFDAEVGTDQGIEVAGYTINVAQNDGAD